MSIVLQKANLADCPAIHRMQVDTFRPLLEKYKDYDTNPGAEPLERVVERMKQPFTDYYFILLEKTATAGVQPQHEKIGAIRVVRIDENTCRISPMFVLPAHQNKGYAQQAILYAESLYPAASRWELDTILQEEKLCRLYEKLGYRRTGEERELQPGMTIAFYEKLVSTGQQRF